MIAFDITPFQTFSNIQQSTRTGTGHAGSCAFCEKCPCRVPASCPIRSETYALRMVDCSCNPRKAGLLSVFNGFQKIQKKEYVFAENRTTLENTAFHQLMPDLSRPQTVCAWSRAANENRLHGRRIFLRFGVDFADAPWYNLGCAINVRRFSLPIALKNEKQWRGVAFEHWLEHSNFKTERLRADLFSADQQLEQSNL